MRARIDEYGKAGWLGLAVLAFLTAWPLGLAIFAFLVASGRTHAWRQEAPCAPGRWFNLRNGGVKSKSWSSVAASHSSGTSAFDSYRMAILGQLEEQRKEFQAFLDRLRLVRDRVEFDRFMAEQRRAVPGHMLSGPHGS